MIVVIFILMPGIVAAIIADKITSHSKWDSFKFVLYSLMLGVMSYALLQILLYFHDAYLALKINHITDTKQQSFNVSFNFKELSWTNLSIWSSALDGGKKLVAWEICSATFLSVFVAFFASWLINFKIFNKIAQKIKVSSKFGDENLYSYYLNAQEIDWVYIRDLEHNLTYQGRIVSHSENDKIQELVLSDVSVYDSNDSCLLYEIPTIYLAKEIGKFVIEAIPANNLR